MQIFKTFFIEQVMQLFVKNKHWILYTAKTIGVKVK